MSFINTPCSLLSVAADAARTEILSETADVLYKVTAGYQEELSRGIRWNDPAVAVRWPVTDPILSDADRRQPRLDRCENPFRI